MKTNSMAKRITSFVLSLVFALSGFAVTGFSSLSANVVKADSGEKFLMAYFTGNLQTEQQIKFAVSTDGANFKPLYGGNAVLQEKSTDTNNYNGYTYTDGVRDPYIFDGHDGYYYCIATDLEATAYGFWGNQSQMVLWRSADLINWSDAYYLNIAQICNAKRGTSFDNSDFQRTWAPEVYYEDGQYMIYFALAGGDYQATRMHYMLTDNLMDWTHYSAPQVLYDPGYDDIDADIIKEGDTYYMFYKDETPGRSTVCLATASNYTGPYTFVGQFDTTSATGGIEGCEVYTVGSNYYLVADRFGAAGNFAIYNMGTSLAAVAGAVNDGHISVTSSPISTVEELYGFTNLTPRHGSIMHISDSQYNALVAASGGITDDDILYNFTKSYSRTADGWAYENGYADSSLHNLDFMFKENGSSVKVAHDAGYITLKNATIFCNDETVRGMLPDDVYTVSFDYSLESTTNLSAPIFALGTGSGAPSENTDYVMIFGNGDIWVRKSGENQDTLVGNKPLTLGATYHYDVVSDGTNITFYRDGEKIGQIAATVDFPTSGTRYAAFGFTDGHSSAGYGYGSYSKIRFRNRAVSANEIYAEANKALIYRKDNGSDTIDGLENAMNVSHSGNHNIAEPIISRNAASYTIAGWVNPGASVDYNSVMIGIGSGKWTPGPYGRYLAIREDGTILFNYCSGSNSGGNWSQHYANIEGAFELQTNTWAYIQVNIVPISDNQVKVVVYKNGVQTKSQDISLITKVDDQDTSGNDYAYGMLGMLQLPTNNIYLGRMPVPNWWENENGTTYAKDVRFYAQAKDPSDLYEEITINKEAPEAIEYVRANLESYDVEALSYRNAYHNGHVATGGFNNVIASATGFACNDVWNNNTKYSDIHYAVFYPTDIVLCYDGVNTPALPCQLEMHCYGDNKTLATIYCSDGGYGESHRNANFRLAHYWTGYTSDYTQWVGDTYAYNHADYPINDNGKAEVEADGNSHIGYYAGWQWDYNFAVPRGEGTGSFFWNKLNYTGTVNTTTYKETYTTTPMKGYMGGDFSIYDCNHNVYVLNYKPIYDILKSNNATVVPNTSSDLKYYYKDVVKGHESDFTEDSLNQFYVAAYKVLKANPLEYSEATYQNNFSGTVDLAAENIESAVNEFNNINLKTRADFSDLENAVADAQDVLDNSADDYTAASIAALDKAVKAVTFLDYNAEERANMPADSYQQDIDAQANAVSAAYTALVGKIVVTYAPLSGNDVVVKFEPGASAAEVEAAAPALPADNYDSTANKHYTYSWDKDFAAATVNATYAQSRDEVAHSYSSFVHNSGTSTHNATCNVNGQSHSDTFDCEYESEYFEASGNTNSFTRYTCKDCNYSYDTDYGAQDWTAYDSAVAEYNSLKNDAAYTAASRTAYQTAVEPLLLDKSDLTISSAGINAAAADITAAKTTLDEVADLSALDAAYAKADALLTELIGKAPVYTQDSLLALVNAVNATNVSTYVNADSATRATYGQAVEAEAATLAGNINTAYDALETATEASPEPEVADAIEVYEEAVQKVTNLDPDAYTPTDSITTAISVANELVGSGSAISYGYGTINGVNSSATADDYDGATFVILTALANSYKTYTVTTDGVDYTGFKNGSATGSESPYSATYGTQVVCVGDDNTAWFLEVETSTMHKELSFQGYGSVLRTKVMGNTNIVAVKQSSEKSRIRIMRAYGETVDTTVDYTDVKKVPMNYSNYINTGSEFTLPAAPAFAYCTFMGYYTTSGEKINESSITIDKDTDIVALYKNTSAECAINATDINGNSINDTYSYNDMVELDGGSGTFAWLEATDETHYRPFYIGQKLSFFATESATLVAVSMEDYFDRYHFSTLPAINLRKEGVIVSGTKAIFNAQIVTESMDDVQEYGVLVGRATTGTITADDLVIENSGTQAGFAVLRAKSTKLVGEANQFTIGVNGLGSLGNYIYRGYVIYNDGTTLRTVYTDVVTVD